MLGAPGLAFETRESTNLQSRIEELATNSSELDADESHRSTYRRIRRNLWP